MRKVLIGVCLSATLVTGLTLVTLLADAPSGAIFTTLSNGSEVNFNIYAAKEDVYLDGGPGPGAPQNAAGLDDGEYVFQVTDPSGQTLLSTDLPRCRRVNVVAGIIDSYVVTQGCVNHLTGNDIDHGATTVQLMPYLDTPNNGNEYKAWMTRTVDFDCPILVPDEVVDCGTGGGNKHGFVPADSKTDNFKVKGSILEIDTRFFPDLNRNGRQDGNEPFMDGLGITWQDALGASNKKWSYYNPALVVFHEAHVEAVEQGRHRITIDNQPGCTVGTVLKDGSALGKKGPQTVTVRVPQDFGSRDTVFIDVACLR